MALDRTQFGDLVRNWVHYDNLAVNLNRQIQNARKVKEEFEVKIMNALKEYKMENAIIQVAGGKLSIAEEKHSNPLTNSRIEELLHEYYERTGRKAADETAEIMKFLKAERGSTTSKKLKKQTA
jgi:predicted patatin/cPLA2 family phospholipase